MLNLLATAYHTGFWHSIMSKVLDNRGLTGRIVYLLLFILLSLRVGGAVSHYCFDGLEPTVTVHFDNLNGHVEHDGELGHLDVEKQVLSDNLLSKILELESVLAIISLFLIALLPQSGGQGNLPIPIRGSNDSKTFLPPQRAPPRSS